jgi:hypothetical protein
MQTMPNNYALNIPPSSTNGLGLNLNEFQNVTVLSLNYFTE